MSVEFYMEVNENTTQIIVCIISAAVVIVAAAKVWIASITARLAEQEDE